MNQQQNSKTLWEHIATMVRGLGAGGVVSGLYCGLFAGFLCFCGGLLMALVGFMGMSIDLFGLGVLIALVGSMCFFAVGFCFGFCLGVLGSLLDGSWGWSVAGFLIGVGMARIFAPPPSLSMLWFGVIPAMLGLWFGWELEQPQSKHRGVAWFQQFRRDSSLAPWPCWERLVWLVGMPLLFVTLYAVKGWPTALHTDSDGLQAMCYDVSGNLLATGGHSIEIWDAHTRLRRTSINSQGSSCLAFSPDSHTLASGYNDGSLYLWDINTGQCLQKLHYHFNDAVSRVAFTPDGKTLVAAGSYGIHLWDVASRTHLRTLPHSHEAGQPLAISPDGKLVAGGSDAKLWNLQTGVLLRTLCPQDTCTSLGFTPNGRELVGVGDSAVQRWQVHPATLLEKLPRPYMDCGTKLSPDAAWFTSLNGYLRGCALTETKTNTVHWQIDDALADAIMLSPDNETVAIGFRNGTVWLWPHRGEGFAPDVARLVMQLFGPL